MRQDIVNRIKDSEIHGDVVGRDKINVNIILLKDNERKYVVTHNANITPVSYFTGRETELRELSQMIESGQKLVLVSGMGGIGKTHICRKLFKKYLDKPTHRFRHIGYIEYNGDMDSSLQNCLKFKKQDNPKHNQEAAWGELEYLASDGKLLLFVDNVDKSIDDDQSLQRLNDIPGAIILTSRQVSLGDEFELYPIGFLDMEQCKEIYEKIRFAGSGKKVKQEETKDLEYLIEDLVGRHTITVELLAHLARTKLWSVKRLREELDQKGFRLEFHKNGELVNIQKSYEVLYDLSRLTEAEQNILEAFSAFPYIPLEAEICNKWLLADAGVSEEDDKLMGLYQKGWLQLNIEQECYSMHPVFAQFIYEKCKPEVEKHIKLIAACQSCLSVAKSGSAIECRKFIPFAESIMKKVCIEDGVEKGKLVGALAQLHLYLAEYAEAEFFYKMNLEMYLKILGEEHTDIAVTYNDLAGVLVRQGKYDEAKNLYKISAEVQRKVQGEENFYMTCIYNNLGYTYKRQGNYEKAEFWIYKSVEMRERILGKKHIETARSYSALAEVLRKQKKYEKAEELFKKSIEIQELSDEINYSNLGSAYSGMASLYADMGRYEDAEKLFEQSLDKQKEILGEEHPKIAVIYCNLAFVLEKKESYNASLDYNLKGYKIMASKVAPLHPDYKVVYRNLERRYLKCNPQGNFEQWLEENMKE